MSSHDTIAVLGTGIMGAPMARNLAEARFPVRVWNRTAGKAEPLRAAGATLAGTPAEAAAGAAVVLTMLTDADAVLATVADALDGAILASGAQAQRERLAPLFDAVGARTFWLGEAGAGTRLKLVANTWVLALVEGLAETLALAEGLGVPPQSFLDAIAGGPLDVVYAQVKGRGMIERAFAPAFPLRHAAKDMRLVEAAAERHGLDVPLVTAIAERLADGVERGHGDLDMSATFLTSAVGR